MIKTTIDTPSYDGYRKYTAAVASNYERDREVEAQWWKEDEFVREYFRDRVAPRLLDLPVGTGRFLQHYRRAQTVIGVDVSDDMLSEARQKLPLLPAGTAASVERGDVFALRFDDREFTHVVVWRLLHLIPPALIPGAVAELCRVAGGEIVVQTYVTRPTPAASPLSGLMRGLRRAARPLKRLVSATSARGAHVAPASAGEAAAPATPWSHIQSYSHPQPDVDALFRTHGFAARSTCHLDTYANCDVRVTVYQR